MKIIFLQIKIIIVLFSLLLSSHKIISNPSQNIALRELVENAKFYLNENPKKTIAIGKEALEKAYLENNLESAAITLAAVGIANINLGNLENATQLIDSAKALYLDNIPNKFLPEVINARITLLYHQKKEKEAYNELDDYKKRVNRFGTDLQKIEFLLLQADFFRRNKQYEEAQKLQEDALSLSKKTNNKALVGKSEYSIGSTYFQQSQFTAAQEWYHKAKITFTEINDTISLIGTIRNISLTNRDLGLFSEAESNLLNALTLANEVGDLKLMGELYNLLGSLSARKGEETRAIEFYNQSLEIREKLELLSSVASTLENISRVQKELNLFEEASENILRAIDIYKELNNLRKLGSAYNEMGNLHAQKGELADALMYYLNSLKIRQQANLETDIAQSLTNIGLTYRRMGSYENALKYFEQSLDLLSEKTNPLSKSYAYIHHGNTLRDLGLPKDALSSYQKSLDLRKKTGNQIFISQSLRSISYAYSDLMAFGEARKHLNQALKIFKDLDNEVGMANIYNELGNVALRENKLEEALSFFQQASTLYAKNFELNMRGLCVRKIGEIQIKLGQFTYALENLQLAYSIAKKTGNSKLLELTLLAFHDYYTSRGQYDQALNYYTKHIEIRDSLKDLTQKEAIWQASLDLELDKKAEEIKKIEGEVETLRTEARLKTIEIKQQKLMRNFFAVTLAFVIIIALGSGYGYFIIRKKNMWLNHANEKLAKSEHDLKKLVQTKDKLFSIIAHDLRSPFTALVGLTEVLAKQAPELDSKEVSEYGSLIHESSEKLLNLIENLLHWSRSQSGKINLVPQNISLGKITNDIESVLKMQANAKGIKLVNSVDETHTAYADYDTISTVVRNLVSNAIKFTQEQGEVTISSHIDNGETVLKVSDNGIGIDKENVDKLFKIEESFSTKGTKQESGTGLGLIICKEFVLQNKGKIAVDSELGEGTTFTISLPKGQHY